MKIICDWKNCKEIGLYRAPLEKDNSKKFRLLCLDHIKIFNKNWNYFENMNDQEIEFFIKSDLTWHRPTQKFGTADNFFNILWNNALGDKFSFFKDDEKEYKNKNRKLTEKDRDAFKIMEIEYNADWTSIQKKFKTLVKKFHPDKHSGNKQYENKLKKITMAYTHLKMMISKKK